MAPSERCNPEPYVPYEQVKGIWEVILQKGRERLRASSWGQHQNTYAFHSDSVVICILFARLPIGGSPKRAADAPPASMNSSRNRHFDSSSSSMAVSKRAVCCCLYSSVPGNRLCGIGQIRYMRDAPVNSRSRTRLVFGQRRNRARYEVE